MAGKPQWTKRTILDALRRYAALTGTTPAAGRAEADTKHLEWLPAPSTVRRHFGTWAAALAALEEAERP